MDRNKYPFFMRVVDDAKTIHVEMHIRGVSTVAEYLYWALDYKAKYEIRSVPPKIADYELVPVAGCAGEYTHGLYWEHGLLKRSEPNVHYLIHHGLDGLPMEFTDLLNGKYREEQIVEVMPLRGGYFTLSLDEWWQRVDHNGGTLASLGIASNRKRGK
jgi:hypothetical protein